MIFQFISEITQKNIRQASSNNSLTRSKRRWTKLKKFFRGLLFGAGVGSIAGLFFAPKKGSATREQLIEDTRGLVQQADELNDVLGDFKSSLQEVLSNVKTVVPEVQKEITDEIEDFKFQAEPRIQQIQEQLNKITSDLPSAE